MAQMFHIKDFCDFCVFRGSNILVSHSCTFVDSQNFVSSCLRVQLIKCLLIRP